MRQKYGSLLWSNDASPVSANIGTLAALISGAVASASSELGPSTPSRCGVVASIFAAAETAKAGLPSVSTAMQSTLWPSTPPAALTAVTAASQPAHISGPKDPSFPENGLNAATVRSGFAASAGWVDEHAVAETSTAAAATSGERARVRRDLQEVMRGCWRSGPIRVKVPPQRRPAVVYERTLPSSYPGPL